MPKISKAARAEIDKAKSSATYKAYLRSGRKGISAPPPLAPSTEGRLDKAVAHEYDREKIFDAERKKNRVHAAKIDKEAQRLYSKKRAALPKHRASMRVMGRLSWLLRHPLFREQATYPLPMGNALTLKEVLGCDAKTFHAHLSRQFKKPITWRNYGKVWHLGHYVPVRLFDCSDPAQLRACFYYGNLQPELIEENLRRLNEKGNLVVGDDFLR